MPYQTKLLNSSDKDDWERFVSSHPYGGPLQLWQWGEIKRSGVWQPLRFGVFQGKKLVAAAQVLRRRLPLELNLLYCPRGPVIDWKSPQVDLVLQEFLGYIRQNYASPKSLFFRLEPQLILPPGASEGAYMRPLHKYFKTIQPQYTSIINLTPLPKDIIYQMDKDTRYGIRRAAREGVKIIKDAGKNIQLWKDFYQMYVKTSAKGFTPRPWRQFEKIFQLMAQSGQAELFLAFLPSVIERQEQDQPQTMVKELPTGAKSLAAAVILKTKRQGCYLWGASDITEKTKNLYAPYLLQWEIINSLKKEKIKEYDLWGIAPTDNPKHAWSGHTLFKKGFGGKRVDYVGAFDLPLSPLYRVYRGLDYLRQRIYQPDLIGI